MSNNNWPSQGGFGRNGFAFGSRSLDSEDDDEDEDDDGGEDDDDEDEDGGDQDDGYPPYLDDEDDEEDFGDGYMDEEGMSDASLSLDGFLHGERFLPQGLRYMQDMMRPFGVYDDSERGGYSGGVSNASEEYLSSDEGEDARRLNEHPWAINRSRYNHYNGFMFLSEMWAIRYNAHFDRRKRREQYSEMRRHRALSKVNHGQMWMSLFDHIKHVNVDGVVKCLLDMHRHFLGGDGTVFGYETRLLNDTSQADVINGVLHSVADQGKRTLLMYAIAVKSLPLVKLLLPSYTWKMSEEEAEAKLRTAQEGGNRRASAGAALGPPAVASNGRTSRASRGSLPSAAAAPPLDGATPAAAAVDAPAEARRRGSGVSSAEPPTTSAGAAATASAAAAAAGRPAGGTTAGDTAAAGPSSAAPAAAAAAAAGYGNGAWSKREAAQVSQGRWHKSLTHARTHVAGMLRSVDRFGCSVFHYAAQYDVPDILQYLMDAYDAARGWDEWFVVNDPSQPNSGGAGGDGDGAAPPAVPPSLFSAELTRKQALMLLCDPQVSIPGATALCLAMLFGASRSAKLLFQSGCHDIEIGKDTPVPATAGTPALESAVDTALICAASGVGSQSRANMAEQCLASGSSDIEARGRFGETALHRAAIKGCARTIEVLLRHGADVDALATPPDGISLEEREPWSPFWGGTALLRASFRGSLPCVELLIKHGAKVGITDADGDTALHTACAHVKVPVILEILRTIEAMPDSEAATILGTVNAYGTLSLHSLLLTVQNMYRAVGEHETMPAVTDAAKRLVAMHKKLGVDINVAESEEKETPLHLAARAGLDAVVQELLAAGADVHVVNNQGVTPLLHAAGSGSVPVVKALLEAGANAAHASERMRETALHVLVLLAPKQDARGDEEEDEPAVAVMRALVTHGANVNAKDGDGRTPLDTAAESRRSRLVLELLHTGADLDWNDEGTGYDAFMSIFMQNDDRGNFDAREVRLSGENCARGLALCKGRDLYFVGSFINRAIEEGFNRMANAIIDDHKARVDADDNTLLMLATRRNWHALVKALVFMDGIELSRENSRQETAMKIAVREGSWECFLALYGAGAEPPDSPNTRLMLSAALHRWLDIEKTLRECLDERKAHADYMFDAAGLVAPALDDLADGEDLRDRSPPAGAPPVASSSQQSAAALPSQSPAPASRVRPTPDGAAPDDGAPPAKRQALDPSAAAAAAAAGEGCGAAGASRGGSPPPAASARTRLPNVTWLIDLLMSNRGDTLSPAQGQPCVAKRDAILQLLRPMMNFMDKVKYFQEELDREREASMDELGYEGYEEETMHLEVRRGSDMLIDMVEQVMGYHEDDYRRDLTVAFQGEDGEDGGGLLKEFCNELAAIIVKPETALFVEVPDGSGHYQPSEKASIQSDAMDVQGLYKSLGVVIGKAISANVCFPVRFTHAMLKQMLGEQLDLADLKTFDPQLHDGLMKYLEYDIATLGMDDVFATEIDMFGDTKVVELKPGGSNISVTDENKEEYVLLLARHKMTESIKPFVKAFCEGLWAVIPLEHLRIFTPAQFGLLIGGNQDVSVKDFQAHVKYSGFTGDEQCIKWFWELVRAMPQTEVRKLLQFITGTSQVPAIGFQGFRDPITITKAGSQRLPSAHTCANQLVMWEYTDRDMLKRHLREILKQPTGFQFR